MSSTSDIDSEELENVALVRMEDVQPNRNIEIAENIVVNDVESGSDCTSQYSQENTSIVDGSEDDNSNVGSMVSIHSEEFIEKGETELIVPEVLDFVEIPADSIKPESPQPNQSTINYIPTSLSPPNSWPTLEILPGGVINLAEKTDPLTTNDRSGEMMYACAKCSQSFKYLFCLVKHVRWHEEEKQRVENMKITSLDKKMADLKQRSKEMDKMMNKHRKGIMEIMDTPKEKPQSKIQKMRQKYISTKRTIISKPKVKRSPKTS